MRLIAIAILSLCLTTAALAAPKAHLWKRWQAHDENSTATIDHSAYDAFLGKYVVTHDHGPNGVRYSRVDDTGRKKLSDYLTSMQKIRIDDYNRDVQRAYWINLYNAETLELVLEHYPVDSIRDIGGGLFSSGPWDKKVLEVEGKKLSLNDIEHRILRPIWHDGMTHYGVNCASMSCPDLRADAYTGDNVYAHLRANARDYVTSPQGVDINANRMTLSRIYDWYAADFGGSTQAIISHLRQHAPPELSARLDALDHIDSYAYDWSLNDETAIEKNSKGKKP